MATLAMNFKHGIKYDVVMDSTESSSKTLSGFNILYTQSQPNTGPNLLTAITPLTNLLQSFTQGTLSNVRWATEQVVNL